MASEAITVPWRCAEALIHRRTTALFAAKQFSELRDALFMSDDVARSELSEGKVNLDIIPLGGAENAAGEDLRQICRDDVQGKPEY